MKRILLILVVLVALGSFNQASAQAKITYYYYPAANVYYNVNAGNYWYYNPDATAWVTVKTLPSGIRITKTPRHIVYYNGTDVWKDNGVHKTKYKIKKTTVTKSTPVQKGKKN